MEACLSEGRAEPRLSERQRQVESHANISNRGFYAIQRSTGIVAPDPVEKDKDGNPVMKPKYGLHALRHFFASWVIERNFSPKRVQALLGHSSIQMTFDVYGHLFPSLEDDHAKFAAGELALVAAGKVIATGFPGGR